jgi:hypothetical protein
MRRDSLRRPPFARPLSPDFGGKGGVTWGLSGGDPLSPGPFPPISGERGVVTWEVSVNRGAFGDLGRIHGWGGWGAA